MRSPKEGYDIDLGAVAQKLVGQFEGDCAASAVAGNDIGAIGLKRLNLPGEVTGQVFDARHRFRLAIEPRGLKAKKGLIVTQIFHEGSVTENVSVVPADCKDRSASPMRLQRNNCALLARKGGGSGEKLEDVRFAPAEFLPELGATGTSRGAAS